MTLQKWAHDPLLLRADFTLVLVAENLNDLSRPFIQSPYNAELEVAFPDLDERQSFVRWFLKTARDGRARFDVLSDVSDLALAQNHGRAGLRPAPLDPRRRARKRGGRLTFEALSDKKKELIEAEAYGLLEFVETDYTLDLVAGHEEAKAHLRAAAEAIKAGRPDVMPMGYLVAGPVGTGKTFLVTTSRARSDPDGQAQELPLAVAGVTEGNLEKILTLLRA